MLAVLTTGSGDGALQITVDGYGVYGNAMSVEGPSGDATFNPVGSLGPAGTTFVSAVAIGVPGVASDNQFLLTGSILGSIPGSLPSLDASTNPQGTLATSSFTLSAGSLLPSLSGLADLQFNLTQDVRAIFNPGAGRIGSLLTQTYVITNPTGSTKTFDLFRYDNSDPIDPTANGGGRVIVDGTEVLFSSANRAGNINANDTIVAFTATGGATPVSGRYELNHFDLVNKIGGDTGSLGNLIRGDGGDADQVMDASFVEFTDVNAALRNQFSLAPGASVTYVTKTLWATGSISASLAQAFGAGPQVTDVLLSGSTWPGGADSVPRTPISFAGNSLVGSNVQLKPIPVQGIDTIEIQFSEDVVVSRSDLTLLTEGETPALLPGSAGFSFNATTNRARWTFDAPLDTGKYSILLNEAGTVTSLSGLELDGEWDNPTSVSDPTSDTFGSGNGVEGGEFRFHFSVLPGDYNRDFSGDAADYTVWRNALGSSNLFGDGDGSGEVDSPDYGVWTAHYGDNVSTAPLAGDYDDSGLVDGDDYDVWTSTFGSTTDLRADGNGDGVVDAADYTVWRNNLGALDPWVYDPPTVTLTWAGEVAQAMEGEYLVRLAAAVDLAALAATLSPTATAVALSTDATIAVIHAPGVGLGDAEAWANSSADVVSIEPNFVTTAALIPNDTVFASEATVDGLWGLNNQGQQQLHWNGTSFVSSGLTGTTDFDVDALEAWNYTTGSSNVVIGVIDTGVDYTHPDLYRNIWLNQGEIPASIKALLTDVNSDGLMTFHDLNHASNSAYVTDFNSNGYIDGGDLLADIDWENGVDDDGNSFEDDLIGWDFYNHDNDPLDDHFHGTHVAGTIGAVGNNGVGVAGVSWNVQIVPIKFLNDFGSGSIAGGVEAINYSTALREEGVNIAATNNSWRGYGRSQNLVDAVVANGDAGLLLVAAAGNETINIDVTAMQPGGFEFDNIITVAAMTASGGLAWFSNYGAVNVDLAAPGDNILSTFPTVSTIAMLDEGFTTMYETISGTSMAAPHVAGVVALLASLNPGATAGLLKDVILSTVDAVPAFSGLMVTGGRLNAHSAVQGLTQLVDVSLFGTTWPNQSLPPFSVGTGNAAPVPYSGVDVVRVKFDRAVSLSANPLDYVKLTVNLGPTVYVTDVSLAPGDATTVVVELSQSLDDHDLTLEVLGTAFDLTVIPGDYNRDSSVDAADYVVWANTQGSTTNLSADGVRNGVIDSADYSLWTANYGDFPVELPQLTEATLFGTQWPNQALPPFSVGLGGAASVPYSAIDTVRFTFDRPVQLSANPLDDVDLTVHLGPPIQVTGVSVDGSDPNTIIVQLSTSLDDHNLTFEVLGTEVDVVVVPGDYNRNGTVDAADYTVWADTQGSTTDLRADGIRNGVIDTADWDFWKSQFGDFPLSYLEVSTLVDESDGNYAAGDLSLREALLLADGTSGPDVIVFAPSLFSAGAATITLAYDGPDGGTVPDHLTVNGYVTVDGPGASLLSISGGGVTRVAHVTSGAVAAFHDVTVVSGGGVTHGGGFYVDGNLTLQGAVVKNSAASSMGGGVYVSSIGALSMAESTVDANSAQFGGGIFGHFGAGQKLTILSSTISNNTATSGGTGGGLNFFSVAGAGTAIGKIVNSTVSGNTAPASGGVRVRYASAQLTIINSSIAANTASLDTAGVHLVNTPSVTLHNTIVADNKMTSGANSNVTGTFQSGSSCNLVGPAGGSGGLVNGTNGNKVLTAGQNSGLSPLADFGGPTKTHTLLVGSPAIDSGSNAQALDAFGNPLTVDQRGRTRIVYNVDIGAVEREILGDYNGDGSVDAADYTVWRNDEGSTTRLVADGDGSGKVDANDYEVWKNHYGNGVGPNLSAAYGIQVVSTAVDDNDGDHTFGDLSLREALSRAAAQAGADMIVFRHTLEGQTITLGSELTVDSQVDVVGRGADLLTVSGNNAVRIFNVSSGVTAKIRDLKIANGNYASGYGGAVVTAGNLTLTGVEIVNSTSQAGGAIYANGGTLSVVSSTLANNYGQYVGGAVYLNGATTTFTNSTISNNGTQYVGGGIYVYGGSLALDHVTVAQNVVTTATNGGGGLAIASSSAIARNTIIADNYSGAALAEDNINGTLNTTLSVYNLIGLGGAGGLTNGTNGNKIGVANPGLAALGNYGGRTRTHALLAGSEAIDAGDPAFSGTPSLDQRGKARVADGDGDTISRLDIGAFELAADEYFGSI